MYIQIIILFILAAFKAKNLQGKLFCSGNMVWESVQKKPATASVYDKYEAAVELCMDGGGNQSEGT